MGLLALCAGTLTASTTQLADGSALNRPEPRVTAADPAEPVVGAADTPSPPPRASAPEARTTIPITGTEPSVAAEVSPPVRVQIADLGVDMEVTPVGVARDQSMEIPEEVAVAGWYRFGPAPGDDAGSTVLAAHVDSVADGLGPFAALAAARPDAEVVLTTADGVRHVYRVQEVTQLQRDELPLETVFDRTGSPRLTVITCGGPFDPELGYRDNVVLTALPLDG